jgi:hypothetical protein
MGRSVQSIDVVLLFLVLLLQSLSADIVARCRVIDDPDSRVFELRRQGEAGAPRWSLAMRSTRTGKRDIVLPLPGARPVIADTILKLDYETLNGGRDIAWSIAPGKSSLDVHANFELEVNIEPDLDPRVEWMNTDGPITAIACTVGRS